MISLEYGDEVKGIIQKVFRYHAQAFWKAFLSLWISMSHCCILGVVNFQIRIILIDVTKSTEKLFPMYLGNWNKIQAFEFSRKKIIAENFYSHICPNLSNLNQRKISYWSGSTYVFMKHDYHSTHQYFFFSFSVTFLPKF